MPKILILDANCAAGIESIQTLGRHGVTVHAASPLVDCLAFRSRYCSLKLHQPSVRSEILGWLARLDEEERYDLIVPATEVSLGVFLDPDCGDDLRRRAVLPSRESLAFAINKESVLQLAKDLAIPVPASVLASNSNIPALPFSYPVAVKPVHSKQVRQGKIVDRRVAYAQNETGLREILTAAPDSAFRYSNWFAATAWVLSCCSCTASPYGTLLIAEFMSFRLQAEEARTAAPLSRLPNCFKVQLRC